MNLTAEQQAAIAAKVNSMTLPRGMGDEHSACSIAAINLALSGRLTDEIPACMSEVVGKWIIQVQDAMPDEMRNSKTWKGLLPLAAGTGRDHEKDRLVLIKDWLWSVVLPHIQPIADAGGYGEQWRAMYQKRTREAAREAADWAAEADEAAGEEDWTAEAAWAARAAWAAAGVAWAAAGAEDWAAKAAWAAEAAWASTMASGDPDAAWEHFDPCGLLQKLMEVGK
jgi:hypothetical protein